MRLRSGITTLHERHRRVPRGDVGHLHRDRPFDDCVDLPRDNPRRAASATPANVPQEADYRYGPVAETAWMVQRTRVHHPNDVTGQAEMAADLRRVSTAPHPGQRQGPFSARSHTRSSPAGPSCQPSRAGSTCSRNTAGVPTRRPTAVASSDVVGRVTLRPVMPSRTTHPCSSAMAYIARCILERLFE